MVKTCQRSWLFQARQIAVPDQPPILLSFCWVLETLELVQCLFRPCQKPMCLDWSARGCTCVCGQTQIRRFLLSFLGHPVKRCCIEFSGSRCLRVSEVPWWPYEAETRLVAILFCWTHQSTTRRWCTASVTVGFWNPQKENQLWSTFVFCTGSLDIPSSQW